MKVDDFCRVRDVTESLTRNLCREDQVVQSMPDASPTKWHRAHTTWFFETFLLEPHEPAFCPHHPAYRSLFNSYYNAVGPQFSRAHRGTLSRPTVDEVTSYRRAVDERVVELLGTFAADDPRWAIVELGLHHEQQHQELLITDIKHALLANPLRPALFTDPLPAASSEGASFVRLDGGTVSIGHDPARGFSFDNETPRHEVLVQPFELSRRVVTCGEVLAFIEAGGYTTPALWLSDGWAHISEHAIHAPLYWFERDEAWFEATLHGVTPLDSARPACHLSFYEADAFATWAGARLPTEQEWEHAATQLRDSAGVFQDDATFHPLGVLHPGATGEGDTDALFGDVWEWTSSAYGPYPRFRALPGALGEYNGKFMSGQRVLRGGSVATPRDHIRPTYRNFFQPDKRWQFTGARLARDL